MSLLGIDVGTTGCKAAVFNTQGSLLSLAYEEYDVQRPRPGWAELDSLEVWQKVKQTIARAAGAAVKDPVTALSVSSLGEAMVPVTRDRRVLGPSLLNFDVRGEEFLVELGIALPAEHLYRINGNTLGNHYSLPKLQWIHQYQPELYKAADLFLHWGSFVSFMLGGEPKVDYSLANRSLLFDVDRGDWSESLLETAGLERQKLPDTVPSGTVIGQVSARLGAELGLSPGVSIVSGAHDQCANALGCGVIHEGQAVYGMGTYICITPVFHQRRSPEVMIERGLNTEHHAVPESFVCFIYNMGGAIVKWYRDTFAYLEHRQARETGKDVYFDLFAELSLGPSPLLVLPYFTATGPPVFTPDSCGVILGLNLESRRGDILKAILEANVFSLKEVVDDLPGTGILIREFRAAGGGSKSDAGLQICADILGSPFLRPTNTESGALGAAILAGLGTGLFPSYEAATQEMVRIEHIFEPDLSLHSRYTERYEQYRQLWPVLRAFLESYRERIPEINPQEDS